MIDHGQTTLEAQLAEIRVHLADMKEDLVEIKTETKATNGRVRALEGWKSRAGGFVAALAILGPVISAVTSALIISQVSV